MIKIVWRVDPEPTGRFRSFAKRGWPTAAYGDADGPVCATIECADEYAHWRVSEGKHGQLTVRLALYNHKPWKWGTYKIPFNTLAEVKEALPRILEIYPQIVPEAFKDSERP